MQNASRVLKLGFCKVCNRQCTYAPTVPVSNLSSNPVHPNCFLQKCSRFNCYRRKCYYMQCGKCQKAFVHSDACEQHTRHKLCIACKASCKSCLQPLKLRYRVCTLCKDAYHQFCSYLNVFPGRKPTTTACTRCLAKRGSSRPWQSAARRCRGKRVACLPFPQVIWTIIAAYAGN